MFSGQTFSEAAFSEQDYSPLDTSAFEAFLAEVTAKRCWLLEVDAFSLAAVDALTGTFADQAFGELSFSSDGGGVTGGVQTLKYSTHGYISRLITGGVAGGDPDAEDYYDARLRIGFRVDRRIVGRDGIGGLARVLASVELINADGELDTLPDNFALDGRRVRLLVGRETDAYADFGVVFTGVVQGVEVGPEALRLSLSDGIAKLERPINETTYAGTGGLEGGADLAGKPKPLCYGQVFNVQPPLVDSVNLIYQVHDGSIQDVTAVYDRGIALLQVAGAPAPGQYSVDTTAGTFTLGATPDGTVTCDAEGDADPRYVERVGDIVPRILATRANLTSSEIEPASFAQLNTDAPAAVGIWIGAEARTVLAVVDELLAGVGAFGGFSRQGAFSAGMVAAPAGKPKATFTSQDILKIERLPLPAAVEPIVWRANVGYQKNHTVQNDFAAAVTAARRTFAAQPLRVASEKDDAVRSQRLLARELNAVEGLYAEAADAETEAGRLLALWGTTRRRLFRVTTRPAALSRELGQVVRLEHPRFGLQLGADARVLGHSVSGPLVEMDVLA